MAVNPTEFWSRYSGLQETQEKAAGREGPGAKKWREMGMGGSAAAGGDGSRDEDRAGRTVGGNYYTPVEWRRRQGGLDPKKPAAGGGGMPTTPTSATAALEGLQGAAPGGPSQANVGMSGGGGPVDLPGVGMLRQGLGTRIYPEMYSALAGLKRVY